MVKASATLEIVLKGEGITPEVIPVRTLADCLTSIQRIAQGDPFTENESEDIRLLGVRKGSAVYKFATNKRTVGSFKRLGLAIHKDNQNDEYVGDVAYAIEELSGLARRLNCRVIAQDTAGKELVSFDSDTYKAIAGRLFVKGITSVNGIVKRVGGSTDSRCGLKLQGQDRMLICNVPMREIARELGAMLYQQVTVIGQATWLKSSFKIVHFTIAKVKRVKSGSLREAFDAVRAAGGKAWDNIREPEKYLNEITGG